MLTRCLGVDTGGGTDILMDGQTDQPSRVLEFHTLYGTKNVNVCNDVFVLPGYQRFSLGVPVGDVATAHPGDGGPDHLSVMTRARGVAVPGYAAQAGEQ